MLSQSHCPGALFCQPWWLDAVAPQRWSHVEVMSGGRLVARMPYVFDERRKNDLVMPLLTQTLGPWFDLGGGKLTNRLTRYKELTDEVIAKLPRFLQFRQNFHYSIENWLPWYWHGFKQTTRYTYVLNALENMDAIWDGFASNIKSDIRKASKQVVIESPDCGDEFFKLNEMVFARQKVRMPYSRAFVERLDDACRRRCQRKIFLARGADGRPHAGCYVVWDSYSAYYLIGGGDPELRRSGATSLCMWEAIQFAATVTNRFDFEGSMIESVERFFRGFGATPIPYMSISKSNLSYPARAGRHLIGSVRRRLSAVLSKE